MEKNPGADTTFATPEKRSLLKGAGLLLSISATSTVFFLLMVLWVNWSKPRLQPEPLSPELRAIVDRIPGKSDALIYIGLKDIRESRLWKEIIPDSLKKAPLFQPKGQLNALIKAAQINPSLDIDTLLVSFKRHGYKEQNYLALVSGHLSQKLSASFLRTHSTTTEIIGGHQCYSLNDSLWLSSFSPGQFALTNNKKMLAESFLFRLEAFSSGTLSLWHSSTRRSINHTSGSLYPPPHGPRVPCKALPQPTRE